jgi:hypothetical protein
MAEENGNGVVDGGALPEEVSVISVSGQDQMQLNNPSMDILEIAEPSVASRQEVSCIYCRGGWRLGLLVMELSWYLVAFC